MYEATGTEAYRDAILQYLKEYATADGIFLEPEGGKEEQGALGLGRSLFFAGQITEKEEYRKAIETLRTKLESWPRNEDGRFKSYENTGKILNGRELYLTQPFYMQYETVYHKKAEYNDIVCQLSGRQVSQENLIDTGWYLMALIDVINDMSIEIFEHYKSLEEIFKKTIKGVLQSGNGLQYSEQESTAESDENQEMIFRIMIAYVILKACNHKILNPEKYSEIGLGLIDGAIDDQFYMDDEASGGILMMACAQSLIFRNNNNQEVQKVG